MARHPPLPVDHEVPRVVVVAAAELGSKHELVDASDWRDEATRVVVIGRALVHYHFIEDDWVVLDISQRALVGNVKNNSAPWDTDSFICQVFTLFYISLSLSSTLSYKHTAYLVVWLLSDRGTVERDGGHVEPI